MRQGHVPAAFHKDELGDIDLPWGKDGKTGFGLAHIIERRNKQGLDGEEFAKRLSKIMKNGEVKDDKNDPDTKYVVSENEKAVVALKWQGDKRTWLVTAYPKYDSLQSPDSNTPLNQAYDDGQNPPSNSEDIQTSQALPGRRTLGETFASEKTPSEDFGTAKSTISTPATESKPVQEDAQGKAKTDMATEAARACRKKCALKLGA